MGTLKDILKHALGGAVIGVLGPGVIGSGPYLIATLTNAPPEELELIKDLTIIACKMGLIVGTGMGAGVGLMEDYSQKEDRYNKSEEDPN